ncbi:type VI secretion system-associated protein TagF [Limobrevibacterium gyesilva]|uniref:Type VI secretion system-associated protein TagF n=1 Tax=Limobrevibacterium gyesilva TaxID=2991712 RepID=A0AA42CES3_9PROT|nr:type VI secretion system-associated protein TagF [Limobrevibacterium gyesilva]
MPEPVASNPVGLCGFYGKLPARGDFVRAGLPRSFTDPWDDWLQAAIAASRAALGEDWLPSWMEAPIWRFALPGGSCGDLAVLGLWMPSIDRAGRHFPLTLALLAPGASAHDLAGRGTLWLDAAEQAGLDALEHVIAPEELTARLDAAPLPDGLAPGSQSNSALWWTAGSPFVPPSSLRLRGLPDPAQFATMIRDPDGNPAHNGCVEAS